MIPIAHIENDFPTKFGIPRQSGRVEALKAKIVFEPEYRNVDACRGLEEFSHIWLIWEFSEAKRAKWSPTAGLTPIQRQQIFTINALNNREGRSYFKEVWICQIGRASCRERV